MNEQKSYFICQHLDTWHQNADTGEYETYCKYHQRPIGEEECNLDCDQFGYCATCAGFSAFNCQSCVIPRENPA